MEFSNQYLTYQEYLELGGSLEETPFNILELEAQKNIDKYTFGTDGLYDGLSGRFFDTR